MAQDVGKINRIIVYTCAFLLGCCVVISGCGNEPQEQKATEGKLRSYYNNTPRYVNEGGNSEFRHVLPNGDSLFYYYFVKKNSHTGDADVSDAIYYTSNGGTKTITWDVSEGKNGHITVTNVQ